ncbi:unnamed protein product [Nezara viridula]|uniref:Uncharacterized protein n=1 Tax=Nezara viridula TaxID=85310 RepID=A0A9P0EF71_NEZVI|nr:unnamed protein product [Nezara viridula]
MLNPSPAAIFFDVNLEADEKVARRGPVLAAPPSIWNGHLQSSMVMSLRGTGSTFSISSLYVFYLAPKESLHEEGSSYIPYVACSYHSKNVVLNGIIC